MRRESRPAPDLDLMVRPCEAGDPPAQEGSSALATIRQHLEVLQGMARRLCGNRADADDLVQDACERALRMAATSMPENPRPWLITILHNLFVSRYRHQCSQPPLVRIVPEHFEILTPDPEIEPAWASLSPAQVEAALSQLDEPFRVVYELHCLSGASYEQIAARLRIPRSTVGTRLARARRKLRALLHAQIVAC